ncbi:MAG TPA: hypothetical protein VG309_03780, partial [Rhizomicrobium sp.]|nr:hypothetical protein [Rhizomicrobium sp.]
MSKLKLSVALLAALATLSACGKNDSSKQTQAAQNSQPAVAKPDGPIPQAQLPRDAIPSHYAITLTIDPTKNRFTGHTEIDVNFASARKTLFIDGLDLHVTKARVSLPNGKTIAAAYSQVDPTGVSYLNFADTVPAGKAKLVFDYDAPYDQSLAGLYQVVDHGDRYAFTQFENSDARRAFPGFDEPGFKTPFDVTVIAPADDKVIANTPVVSDTG